jgi:putative tricarboxylic transport membrane protein
MRLVMERRSETPISLMLISPMIAVALTMISAAIMFALLGKDPVKGLIAACFGLLLGTVGIDGVSGHERFTFDDMNLAGGLHVVVVLTGLYALPPIFMLAEEAARRYAQNITFEQYLPPLVRAKT